jgi:hypothetical protein
VTTHSKQSGYVGLGVSGFTFGAGCLLDIHSVFIIQYVIIINYKDSDKKCNLN